MYRVLKINRMLFLILIVAAVTTCCDGRDRVYQTNTEILKDNNLYESFSHKIAYIPQSYTEINTDTVLNNNFRIKIKYYTLPQDSVLIKKTIPPKTNMWYYYHNFEARLVISKQGTPILDVFINKALFKNFETDWFWKEAIMQFLWIDYESITKHSVNINVSFCIPESTRCKDYVLTVDDLGALKINEINLSLLNI